VSDFRFEASIRDEALSVYETWKDDAFVRSRQRRNVDGDRSEVTRDEFWLKLVAALLTTQQRSGPGAPINLLLGRNPFPLRLSRCQAEDDVEAYVRCVLLKSSGIRRWKIIAEDLAANLAWLGRDGNWSRLMGWLQELEGEHTAGSERRVARRLAANFWGLGPKQSRNVLQMLGLSKYEMPLDSRVASWLNAVNFPVVVTPKLLARESSYCDVLDEVQVLCEEIGVYPALFDSAVFASFDGGAWTDDNVD
jgi:hypothetical protein